MTVRSILLILLLINAVAFYWFKGQQAQRESIHHARRSAVELPGVKRLNLLREVRADTAYRGAENTEADENCLVLGPVSDEMVGGLRDGLQDSGVDFTTARTERKEISGYWVYLPPVANRELAQEKLNELHEQGIDSFVFEGGELVNGISLGIFSSSANASQRKDELSRRGYHPEVQAATREVVEHWLVFALEWRARLSQQFWDDLTEMAAQAEVLEKPCQAVASSGDFQ